MAFLVKYTTLSGTSVVSLHPRPTEVVYPERRSFKKRDTKDGGTVINRPLADARPRQWIWRRYRLWIYEYRVQWELLQSLDCKERWQNSLEPTVQIWENETGGDSGFGETTGGDPDLVAYTNLVWTTVRFIQVSREIAKGGGPVTFDTSTVEFVIEDDAFETF
jgi:hypothetical protein